MNALLRSGDARIDGFLCPGHVAVIIGANSFAQIVRDYRRGCAVVGFEDHQIAEGLAALTEMGIAREPRLLNLYPQAVTRWGNRRARNIIREVFEPADAQWRGLGLLPRSGSQLRKQFAKFDARLRFGLVAREVLESPKCRCGDVITARCTPEDCPLFGRTCTPISPIGPCMVSSEGTCQAWFKYCRRNGSCKRIQEAMV
jgi:hydrogenase expression/formation protein HypD